MNEILSLLKRRLTLSIPAVFLAAALAYGYGNVAGAADNYSAEEKIYLKSVTPILFEYSQIASQVSANVLPLLSAPVEKCSGEFSYYGGIMSSLGKHFGAITPPARFGSVHTNSTAAISEYETALNLYAAACVEEDFGAKEGLVSRAGANVNGSVGIIGKVYREIGDLGTAAAPALSGRTAAPEDLTESDIKTAEELYVEEEYEAESAAAAPPRAAEPKTREEVIRELAGQVAPGEETADVKPRAEAPQKSAPAAPAPEAPSVKAPEPVKPAPIVPVAVPAETPVKEAPVVAAPKPAVPPPAPVLEKPESAPIEAAPVKEQVIVPPPAPAAPSAVPDAARENAASALVGPEPMQAETGLSETVTEETMDTTALGPGTMDEELTEEALPEDEIRSWCSRYETDFERSACVTKRTAARDKTEVLLSAYEDGTPEREIVEKCRSDWKEGITYNYEMVISCTQFFCTQKDLEGCKDLSE